MGSALAIGLFDDFGTLGVLFLRMSLGALLLCVVYRAALGPALRQAPLPTLLLGLVMAGQSAAFYEALLRIPLGIAVAIEFVGPLAVALFGLRRPADLACVALAGVGIFLLTPQIGSDLDPAGIGFALAAAFGWAAFILGGRWLGQKLEGGVGLAVAMAIASLVLLPISGFQAIARLAEAPGHLPAVMGVAIFASAIPLLFEYLALKRMKPKTYGILISTEPVVASLIGIALLSETIGLQGWVAVGLITLASAAAALLGRRSA